MSNVISLGRHFENFVEEQIKSGRYADASDIVCTGLQLLEEQERAHQVTLAKLKCLIEEGSASGDAGPLNVRALYAEVAAIVAKS